MECTHCCPLIDPDTKLVVTYSKKPKRFPVDATPLAPRNVVVDLGVDPPLTRKQRRLAKITLVGVRYNQSRVSRNTLVAGVKFKKTGSYREARR